MLLGSITAAKCGFAPAAPHSLSHKASIRLVSIAIICLSLCFPALPAHAQTVLAKVPVSPHPQAITLNPLSNKAYTFDGPTNDVAEIDGATNTTQFISLGTPPENPLNGAIAVNPFTNLRRKYREQQCRRHRWRNACGDVCGYRGASRGSRRKSLHQQGLYSEF